MPLPIEPGTDGIDTVATGTIHRSAFVSYALPMLSDEVQLSLGAEFVRPAAEA